MVSRSFSSYRVCDTLGIGTVGVIHRAIDKSSGAEVALKILQPVVSRDPLIRQRFEREIKVLSKLSHPDIVAFHDHGVESERLFYSMEMLDGEGLQMILDRHERLPLPAVIDVDWQLCSALQHVHNHGIVHRDVRPSNVYLTTEGLVKLADFGIALDTGASGITDQGLTVGSYMYMSPEQIRGEHAVTAKSDLYALGCLLYEMLAGEPPFTGTNFARIFDQHLSAPVPSLRSSCSGCPDEFEILVTELLAEDPDQRPHNARTVQGRLSDAMTALLGIRETEALRRCHTQGSTRLSRFVVPAKTVVTELTWRQLGLTAAGIVSLSVLAIVVRLLTG